MRITNELAAEVRAELERNILGHPENGTSAPNMLHAIRTAFACRHGCGADREAMDGVSRVLAEHWWNLARAGIVALVGDELSGFSSAWITDFGRRVLASKEPSPHDESGYLDSFRSRIKTVDPIVIDYIAESAAAWRTNLHRASTVMLGCACERMIILLAEGIATKNIAPFSDKIRKQLATPTPIASIFDQCLHALKAVNLPATVGDGLDRKLTPIFERTRVLRNKSGHPSGEEILSEEAHAGLLLAPAFYQYVDTLLAALA